MYQSGCDVLEEMAGLYGPYNQTGLICAIAPENGEDAEHEEEQGRGLGHEDRVERLPDLVSLPLLFPGPLGVALMPQDHQVRGDERAGARG